MPVTNATAERDSFEAERDVRRLCGGGCNESSLSLPSSTIGALSAVPPGGACGRAGEPRSIGVDDEVPGSRCIGGAGVGCVGCGLTGGGRGGAGAPDPGIGAVPLLAAAPGWPPTRKGIAPVQ